MPEKSKGRILRSIALLSVGAVLGWWGRRVLVPEMPKSTEHLIPIADRESVAVRPVNGTVPMRTRDQASDVGPGDPVRERLQALAWMRKNMQGVVIIPFNGIDRLSAQFISTFGLTGSEVAILNEKLAQAKNSMDQLSIACASMRMNSGNNQVTVHVPSFPTEGGQIRDQLMQSFADVLGPERYQDMNALVGTTFDTAFKQFGLGDTTYELDLTPTTQNNGQTVYAIRETTRYPDGGSSIGNSNLGTSGISEVFPVLSHFVPQDILVPAK